LLDWFRDDAVVADVKLQAAHCFQPDAVAKTPVRLYLFAEQACVLISDNPSSM
jgi:hypothetical protein